MKRFLNRSTIIIVFLFFLALGIRLYGLNWDQGQHLHPDERFLTMVSTDIKFPSSIGQYFDTQSSSLNPYNYPNYKFFVYGTLPIFITKFVANIFRLDTYESLVLVGRVLSAIFDSINIVLIYFISLKIFKTKSKIIFIPSLLYAFCVLPIQLSHFFTVDTFLNTLILATFVLLVYNQFLLGAIFFGLALACKISALYFIPVILLFLIFKPKYFLTGILTLLTFRIFQPYAFNGLFYINPDFIQSLKTLLAYSKLDGYYPPGVQWLSIGSPLLFSLKNIMLWGLGIPISLGIIFSLKKINNKIVIYMLIWILLLYFYQGSQTSPTMRYFLPIYPFLILLFVYLSQAKKLLKFVIFFHLIFGVLFLNIYTHNHTRVDASYWIYNNISSGSNITNEYWDDPLPLNIFSQNSSLYNGITLTPYDPDSPEKMAKLNTQLSSANYLIMSSNRLWHSIPFVPKLYPLTSIFYSDLFSGKSNFTKILEVNSYPGVSLSFLNKCYFIGPTNYPGVTNSWFTVDNSCLYPGIYFRDDTAEEAFTVYDHPKVLIFQRKN